MTIQSTPQTNSFPGKRDRERERESVCERGGRGSTREEGEGVRERRGSIK